MKVYIFEMSNTYGNLRAVDFGDGTYTLELDDYSSRSVQHISKELFELLIKDLKLLDVIE